MPASPTQVSKEVVLSEGGIYGVTAGRQRFRDWTVALLAGGVLFLIVVATVWDLILLTSFQPPTLPSSVDAQAWTNAQRAAIEANTDRVVKIFGEIVLKGLMPAFLALSSFFAGSHRRD